jgi:hypothetical protein
MERAVTAQPRVASVRDGTRRHHGREWATAVCRQAGFEPEVRYTSTDLQIHLRLVESGLAAALLPDKVQAARPPSGPRGSAWLGPGLSSTSRLPGRTRLVLVEVDQVAARVVEDGIHAPVVPPGGFGDERHAVGLEPLGVPLAVVGAQ